MPRYCIFSVKNFSQDFVHVKEAALNLPVQDSYQADAAVGLLGVDFLGLR